jgi:hypothetical protein
MDAMAIQWGEVPFENLGPFEGWSGPGGSGLFVVMVQPHPETNPGEYRALFFGETDNLSSSEFFRHHPKFRCCVSEAGKVEGLFFASSPLEGSTQDQRKMVQRLLADQFRPICNW